MDLVAKIKGTEKVVKFLENNPRDFNVHRTSNDNLIVTLPVGEDGRCNIPSILFGERVLMNLEEGRTADGLVTVIADSHGNPLWPYWVRNRKSQCQQDGIDVRFSISGGATLVTVNRLGLLILSSVSLKKFFDPDEKTDYIQVRTEERMSAILKRNGGKFLFPSQEFQRRPYLKGYSSVIEAAIAKTNKPNAGPVYFLEREAAVVFHETDGSTVVMTASDKGTPVFSGGIAISDHAQGYTGMTVRAGQ